MNEANAPRRTHVEVHEIKRIVQIHKRLWIARLTRHSVYTLADFF